MLQAIEQITDRWIVINAAGGLENRQRRVRVKIVLGRLSMGWETFAYQRQRTATRISIKFL